MCVPGEAMLLSRARSAAVQASRARLAALRPGCCSAAQGLGQRGLREWGTLRERATRWLERRRAAGSRRASRASGGFGGRCAREGTSSSAEFLFASGREIPDGIEYAGDPVAKEGAARGRHKERGQRPGVVDGLTAIAALPPRKADEARRRASSPSSRAASRARARSWRGRRLEKAKAAA